MRLTYTPMTVVELRAAIARPGFIVQGAARKGTAARMPQVPHDVRRPGVRVPLTHAIVTRVSDDGMVRFESGNGPWFGWVSINDLLFALDPL